MSCATILSHTLSCSHTHNDRINVAYIADNDQHGFSHTHCQNEREDLSINGVLMIMTLGSDSWRYHHWRVSILWRNNYKFFGWILINFLRRVKVKLIPKNDGISLIVVFMTIISLVLTCYLKVEISFYFYQFSSVHRRIDIEVFMMTNNFSPNTASKRSWIVPSYSGNMNWFWAVASYSNHERW